MEWDGTGPHTYNQLMSDVLRVVPTKRQKKKTSYSVRKQRKFLQIPALTLIYLVIEIHSLAFHSFMRCYKGFLWHFSAIAFPGSLEEGPFKWFRLVDNL